MKENVGGFDKYLRIVLGISNTYCRIYLRILVGVDRYHPIINRVG